MRKETINAFKLLIEKTELLNSFSFIKDPKITSFKWSENNGNDTLEIFGHNDESIHAFILTYRFFFDKKEHCSFRWLFENVLDDPELSEKWKNNFINLRNDLNEYLDSYPPMKLTDSDHKSGLTYRDIQHLFMFGDLTHSTWNPENRSEFKKIMVNKISEGILKSQFVAILLVTYDKVLKLSELCESELSDFL